MKMTLETHGMKELVANLEKIAKAAMDTEPKVKQVLLKPAEAIRDHAKSIVPVRTGNLRDAIYATTGPADLPGAIAGVSLNAAPYAADVEYGTSRTPAQPYFRPAVTQTEARYADDIAPGIAKIVADEAEQNAYHAPGN